MTFNTPESIKSLTVRPPKLGGNRRVGVFATRSPFRPNAIGLSCVKLEGVRHEDGLGDVLIVSGADVKLRPGRLCDLCPTMLDLMGLAKPAQMTGESLIVK